MREHLAPKAPGEQNTPVFHLKQSPGAIVDIEFMVQYAVLAWSVKHPSLAVYSDNIRILEALGREGLFSADDVDILTTAFKDYRASSHRQSLQQQSAELPADAFDHHRRAVLRIWRQLFEMASDK